MSTMKLKSPPKTVTANWNTPPDALVAMVWKLVKRFENCDVAASVLALAGRYLLMTPVRSPIWAKNTGTKR